jgi:hypothetical protein
MLGSVRWRCLAALMLAVLLGGCVYAPYPGYGYYDGGYYGGPYYGGGTVVVGSGWGWHHDGWHRWHDWR